jgi:RNase adaptor protein for sRNA GlmZ degradation
MATKRLKRPRDPVSLAKLVGDIATGQVEDQREDKRDQAAVALGQRGGKARASAISKKRRAEIARKAAAKRWAKV